MQKVRHGFTLWKKHGVRYLVIPSFVEAGGALCAVSTRIGGVSPKPFDTLNLSRKREKSEENFQENISRFASAAGFNHEKAVAINYAHSAVLHRVENKDAGAGIVAAPLEDVCDGLYTDEPGLAMVTFHADCAPIIFFDPKNHVPRQYAMPDGAAYAAHITALMPVDAMTCLLAAVPKTIYWRLSARASVYHTYEVGAMKSASVFEKGVWQQYDCC